MGCGVGHGEGDRNGEGRMRSNNPHRDRMEQGREGKGGEGKGREEDDCVQKIPTSVQRHSLRAFRLPIYDEHNRRMKVFLTIYTSYGVHRSKYTYDKHTI